MTKGHAKIRERRLIILNKLDEPVHVAVTRSAGTAFRYVVSPRRVPLPMTGAVVHREDLNPNEMFKAEGLSPKEIPIVERRGWVVQPMLGLQQAKKDGVHLLVFVLRPPGSKKEGPS